MTDHNGARPQRTEAQKRTVENLIPFKKGHDARRNTKGRPKSFDHFRDIAQELAGKEIDDGEGGRITVAEAILRTWAKSKEPQLQRAFIEYAFGKVPERLEEPIEPKTTLILHYGHERQKRDQDYRGMAPGLPPGPD